MVKIETIAIFCQLFDNHGGRRSIAGTAQVLHPTPRVDFFLFPKILKGIAFVNPRASLARAAFKRDFLYNHGSRRSIAGTAQELQPTFFLDIQGGRRSIAGTAQATLPHHPRPTLSPRTSALSLGMSESG